MNMSNYREAYANSKRKKKSSEKAIECAIQWPILVRRMICLYEDKVKLEDKNENPWYPEMVKYNIDPELVRDARDFVNFCIAEDEKKITKIRWSA